MSLGILVLVLSAALFCTASEKPKAKLGGVFPITDLSDWGLVRAAEFAMQFLASQSNKDIVVTLENITSATRQVVAGMKHNFSARVRVEDSSDTGKNVVTSCYFVVWSKPSGDIEVISHSCQDGSLFE